MKNFTNYKVYVLILFLIITTVTFSQTVTFYTSSLMLKIAGIDNKELSEWSSPRDASFVIQMDLTRNSIVLTGPTGKKQEYSITKSYPEIIDNEWGTRRFICLDESGEKVEWESQRQINGKKSHLIFASSAIIIAYEIDKIE